MTGYSLEPILKRERESVDNRGSSRAILAGSSKAPSGKTAASEHAKRHVLTRPPCACQDRHFSRGNTSIM